MEKLNMDVFTCFSKDWALVTCGEKEDYNTMLIGWIQDIQKSILIKMNTLLSHSSQKVMKKILAILEEYQEEMKTRLLIHH